MKLSVVKITKMIRNGMEYSSIYIITFIGMSAIKFTVLNFYIIHVVSIENIGIQCSSVIINYI